MSEPSSKHWALRHSSKPFARWSADTDQAFLLALRMTGRVRDAAAAIGRSVSCAYKRRRRDPDFAARWDAAVADQHAAWIAEQGKAAKPVAEEPLDAKALVALAQEAAYAAGGLFHLRATREETNAALIKAIAAAKKRLARKAEQEGGGD